jgi:hypothetical protein
MRLRLQRKEGLENQSSLPPPILLDAKLQATCERKHFESIK